jgi:type I restriction enzyme S subunit
MRNVSQDKVRAVKMLLPPKSEQDRIASRIEELFSSIDEGERALERVRVLVERYRQSVLKAAVTGELTREWREQHSGELESGEALLTRILEARRQAWEKSELAKMTAKGQRPANDQWKKRYKEPEHPSVGALTGLPAGWAWLSVDQLCREFGNGLSKKPRHTPPGIPILRISAVRTLAVDPNDVRYYEAGNDEQLDKAYVSQGDLLFTRYNGSRELVGVSGVYEGVEAVLHPDKLIKARVVAESLVLPHYLALALNAGASANFLAGAVKTSAGQHGISGGDIKICPVPLPPIHEQETIASIQASVAERCSGILSYIATETARISALRQKVLIAAFEGKLVPQDPNDEPASVLLERIAAERTAYGSTARPKQKRAGKKKAKA